MTFNLYKTTSGCGYGESALLVPLVEGGNRYLCIQHNCGMYPNSIYTVGEVQELGVDEVCLLSTHKIDPLENKITGISFTETFLWQVFLERYYPLNNSSSIERIRHMAIWWKDSTKEINAFGIDRGSVEICYHVNTNGLMSLDGEDIDKHTIGFITDKIRFVDRKEAYQIAKASGQLVLLDSRELLFSNNCAL